MAPFAMACAANWLPLKLAPFKAKKMLPGLMFRVSVEIPVLTRNLW
jgi:hypothetical protein